MWYECLGLLVGQVVCPYSLVTSSLVHVEHKHYNSQNFTCTGQSNWFLCGLTSVSCLGLPVLLTPQFVSPYDLIALSLINSGPLVLSWLFPWPLMVFLVVHPCYSHHIIVSLFGNSWRSHHSCLVNGPSCTPVCQPMFLSCPHLSSMNHLFCPGWSIHFLLCSCPSTLDNHTTSLCPCLSGLDVLTTFLWPLITSVVVECLQVFTRFQYPLGAVCNVVVHPSETGHSDNLRCDPLSLSTPTGWWSVVSSVTTWGCSVPLLWTVSNSTGFCVYFSLSWVPSNLLVPLLLSPNILVTSSLVHSKDNILIFS